MVFAVFEDKDAIRLQQVFLEDERRDGRQFLQCIGRVGKDKVELLFTALDKLKRIAPDRHHLFKHLGTVLFCLTRLRGVAVKQRRTVPGCLKFLQTLLDEAVMVAVGLDADYTAAAPREQFERDAARTREEIQCRRILEVEIAREHVEDVLFGEVGRRPRLKRAWDIEMPSLIFPSNDPHYSLITIHYSLITIHYSLLCQQFVQVEWHHVSMLQIPAHLLQNPVLIGDVAQDVNLVVLRLQVQLLPHVEQEVEGIVGTGGLKRVAELKAVLLERADVELLVVEIAVELAAMTSEAALVQIGPDGYHVMHQLHVVEVVGEHHQQVFVDGVHADGIQRGQHVEFHHILIVSGEGMQVECRSVGFLKLLDGHHQRGGVDHYACTGEVDLPGEGSESLAQVCGHRDAALHHVGLKLNRLFRIRLVRDHKRQRIVPHADRQLLAIRDTCCGHPLVHCRHHTGHAYGQQSCRHQRQRNVDLSVTNMHIACKGTNYLAKTEKISSK